MLKSIRHSFIALGLIIVSATSLCALPTVPSSPVKEAEAIAQANKIARVLPQITVYKADGESMLPHYGENSILMVKTISFHALKEGMIAVYRDADNDLVGHVVVSKYDTFANTKGSTNRSIDPLPVSANNLVGIVVGSLHTAEKLSTINIPSVIGKKY